MASFIPIPDFKLGSTDLTIPALALGTWQSAPGEVKVAVEHAIKCGYTHLDCAAAYGNENEVGEGIRAAGVDRSKLFVTTKLWCTSHTNVEAGLDASLKDLGLDYVDLYLIHWPIALNHAGNHPKFPTLENGDRDINFERKLSDTWADMEKLLSTGKVKAIGVSNFSEPFLEELKKTWKVKPAVNQVEIHPYLPQTNLVKYLLENGITPQAYSPLGSTSSPIFEEEAVKELAAKYQVGPGSILLSYPIARGIVVLAKSVTPKRIEENLKILKLTPDDVAKLDAVHVQKGTKRFVRPNWAPIDLKFENW
ncbi:Aldo/keto reductase [Meredithblackwellia eburnea MCA 4105]